MAVFRINKNLCAFSPSGLYFAHALQQELTVRNSKTLKSTETFIFTNTIELIEWSPNGQYIFCANVKEAIVQIFSIQNPKWKCKWTAGSAGLEKITWVPDGKSLLITSDLNIHISIWTLTDQNIVNIWNLKSSISNIALNEFGGKLAVVVTADGADNVEIYKMDNWKLSRKLMCDKLYSIDGIRWSNNGELLAIWCATIGKSRLLIYSVVTDAHIGAFSGQDNVDNQSMTTLKVEGFSREFIRGIEKIVFSPSGQLLAVAGYNETIVIINHITWSIILQLYCSPVIKEEHYLSRVYKEVTIDKKNSRNNSVSRLIAEQNQRHPLDEINERPINIIIDAKQNNYEICIAAVDILEFSPCGKFLAIKHQLYPSTLWIWDLMADSLDYILLKNSISGISWEPTRTRLLIFSESSIIIEWRTGHNPSYFESPQGMAVINGKWHPNGEIIALYGYNKTSVIRLKD
ncbi:hypothetical protein PV328_005120 [Microctonus aethiopoides]|uniref:WD repeat-containing protein WRAP73 n=1 Tax=Microctonus aethiopoides TaxID=144406 RepID=A0AA39KS35_9HYME|nr:hypothetical protein PV328_005120 [Microctonus aethiopoides]